MYQCRCRHCKARRTLAKHPDDYARPPKCNCWFFDNKLKAWRHGEFRVDGHRMTQKRLRADKRTDPGPTCKCAALPGEDGQNRPHRRGSIPECEHSKMRREELWTTF